MEAERNRYVYKIFAGDDLAPFYIGVGQEKTRTNRARREYIHVVEAKRSGWKSNAAKNVFILDCIKNNLALRYEYERGLTTDEAHAREIELIQQLGRRDLGTGCLLNACAGGWGSREKSPSEIAKARAFRHTEEAKARIAAKHLGMAQSEEARAKIKSARAKQVLPFGEAHPRFGHGSDAPEKIKFRDATRRYRARMRGEDVPLISRKHTEETKAKMRAVKLGKRPSEIAKAKMRQSQQRRRAWEQNDAGILNAPQT